METVWSSRKRLLFFGLPFTFTKYTLTKEKVLVDTGFLNKKQEEVRLYRILDLTLTRSLAQRIFGLGTISCKTSDKALPVLELINVRNAMNIKYRLLCKRLIEEGKRVGVIQYYNVLFIMELLSDKDIWSLEQWVNGMNNLYMKDIHNWCRLHFIKYHTVFVYMKEYPVKANIWNGYSYIRWRMERRMNLG